MTRLLIDTFVVQQHVPHTHIGTGWWDEELTGLYKITTMGKLKYTLMVVLETNEGGNAEKNQNNAFSKNIS